MVNIYLAYKCAEGKEEVRNQIAEGKRKISVGRDQKEERIRNYREEGKKKQTKIYRMLLIRL
jgi:hypothetical protein